jgi:chemosensory pili system protein ChpA (sensor histidine kinase/response regulator)
LVDAAASRGFRSVELDGLNSALADSSDDEAAAPQSSGIAGHQALQTAAAALREEITSVKDQLDLLVRSGDPTLDQLRQLSAPLKRIGSTLSVLGFESSRAIVADQVDSLSAIAASGSIDDSVLMGVAAALLQVDENLTAVTEQRRRPVGVGEPSAIIDDAQLTVLAEARNGLEHVKQCVVDYVSSNWDRTRLSEVPSLLGAVRGALTMVTLTRPADLLGRCSAFVERKLLSGKIPDWVTLDTFADAISGVDYYLERLCEQTSPGEDIVTRVERSVQLLEGARLLDEAPPNEPDEARGDRTLGRVFDDNMPEDAPLLEDEATESFVLTDEAEAPLAEQPAGDRDADLSGVRDDTADETAVDAVLEDIAEEARDHAVPMHAARSPAEDAGSDTFELVLEEEDGQPAVRPTSPSELQFDLSSELFDEVADDEPSEPSSPPVLRVVPKAPREDSVAKAPAAPPPPPPAPVVATSTAAPTLDEPDQEIIEIFIEEVGEVLESLDGAIDTWSASNLGDVAALKEVRRAFHTLKGSGRIVGAKAIGELAWAVENLLNRVIDETLEPNRQIVAVVRQARALVPGLRDAFRARSACDEAAVERVSERADLLASGGELEDLASDAEVSAPAATTTTEPIEPEIDEELERTIEEVIEIEAVADDVTEVNEPEVTDEVGEPVDETRTLFARELAQLLDTIDEARDREPTGEALARALHTVRGSASMAVSRTSNVSSRRFIKPCSRRSTRV